MKSKDQLRTFFKDQLKNLSQKRREEGSQKACQDLAIFSSAYKRVLSFVSFKQELDLKELNSFLEKEKKLLLPALDGTSLAIYEVFDLKNLIPSSYGVFQPDPSKCTKVILSKDDLIIVPGLAFDLRCYRVGYGKGHYDRFLESNPNIKTVGVGFEEQLALEGISVECHDKQLEAVFLF